MSRKKHTISLVFCLLLLSGGVARSSFAIDLAYLQEKSINNRDLVKTYRSDVEISEKNIAISNSSYYPSVNLFTNLSTSDSSVSVPSDERTQVTGSVKLNLFNGFRDENNVLISQYKNNISQHNLSSIVQEVLWNVSVRFLEVYEKKSSLEVARDNFKTLEKVYNDSMVKYKLGFIGEGDLLKFRVDYDNANIAKIKAESDLDKSLVDLWHESTVTSMLDELDFSYFKNLPERKSQEEYTQQMLAHRGEIKVYDRLIDVAASTIDIGYSSYYPTIDLVGQYRKFGELSLDPGDYENEFELMLVMGLNLFEGYSTTNTIEKNKIELQKLRYERKELINQYKRDLKKKYLDFMLSGETVAAASNAIEYAEENLRTSNNLYNEGLQSESDLLEAIANLTRAKYNYIAVVKTVFLNFFDLERMSETFASNW